jgi:hypothetical protein
MGLRQEQTMAADSALKRKYDIMRNQVSQQAEAAGQQQESALQRRLASLGNLQSGAAIKQQQTLGQNVAQAKAQATQGIDVAQAGEEAQQAQQEKAMQFSRAEREAQQKFASGERVAGQQFVSGQSDIQRNFQKQMADQDAAFREKVFSVESGFKREQMDLASQEMRDNKNITAFNAFASAMESGNPAAYQEALSRLGAQLGIDMNYGSLPGAGGSSLGSRAAKAVGGSTVGNLAMGPVGGVFGAIGGMSDWF